jgi:hypothetical protein
MMPENKTSEAIDKAKQARALLVEAAEIMRELGSYMRAMDIEEAIEYIDGALD